MLPSHGIFSWKSSRLHKLNWLIRYRWNSVPECWYCEEYDDYEFPLYESQPQRKISTAQIHINGFTFPRCTPSKKIENINIVLDPPRSESLDSTEDYNHLESSDVDYNSDSFNSCTDNSNRSESPYTRFRNSRNKSIELEKIVQNNANLKSHGDSFVRQMVLALERGGSFCSSISDRDWEEQNSSQYLGSNSSSKSGCYLTEDGDLECECGSSEDGELHWGSLNQFDLPRSSSAISIMNRTGRSPALSPIRSPIFEKDEDQIMVKDQLEKIARKNGNSKFSTLDSGYSDDMQSHNTSLTSEKPSIYSPEVESFIKSGPPVMRSFFVWYIQVLFAS